MHTGVIFNIMRYSIHDGPGIRSTVFFKGCPLACWWCHNPESQSGVPELMLSDTKCVGCGDCLKECDNEALRGEEQWPGDVRKCTFCGKCAAVCHSGAREMAGRQVSVADVMSTVEKDVIFYDQSGGGVTFSGGEPLMQPAFLQSLLLSCKKKYIHTAIDTSGFADTETLLCISKLTDLFLYDLKIMDEERHCKYTGVSNQIILKNLRELAMRHEAVHIRFPLIPGVNDDRDNVAMLGEFVAALRGVTQITVLPYQQMGVHKYDRLQKQYRLQNMTHPGSEEIQAVAQKLKEYGLTVKIGG